MHESSAPIPLTELPRPPFPAAVLPSWVRRFVEALACATQTPVDLAAMLALAVLAAACAKRVVVQAYAGWTEPVNLYVAIALPPANRKSATFAAMVAPLATYEAGELARAAPVSVVGTGTVAGEATAEPAPPRLLADDCSPERLATLLRDHGGRMAVMAPEGDLFDLLAGRYSGGTPNLGVFLRGHAGDDLRVDRVGRPSEYVAAPALTLGLAVQPEVVAGLAGKPGFRGRGLLGRILFALPESFVGRRAIHPPPVPREVRQAYHDGVTVLLRLPGASGTDGSPKVLRLDRAAEATLAGFEAEIEPRLSEFGDLGPISDWAGKLVGAVVRIAGLLHMAEHVAQDAPWEVPVAQEMIEGAIEIGHYLIAHAQVAFGLMGADPVTEDARHILRWLETRGVETVSKRELFIGTRGRFKRVEALEPALALLVSHGYLVRQDAEAADGPGRPPSPVYQVLVA